jgi:hypothetical protein
LSASAHCQDDVYRQPQSGKIAWGAAWTYRMSRNTEDARLAATVANNLASTQNAEGWWTAANSYQRTLETSPRPSIDVTGEFVAHLAWVESTVS